MRIAFAQINTTVADFEGNTAKVLKAIGKAVKEKADLILFPEFTTFGYSPRDLLDHPDMIEKNIRAARAIAKGSPKDLGVVFGYVAKNPSAKGRPLLNQAVLASGGRILHEQSKTLLPTYDVFDEARYFEPAFAQTPFDFKGVRLGLTVCEDLWGDHFSYAQDPVAVLKQQGAELILNLAASPFSMEKQKLRRRVFSAIAKRHRIPIAYCNLVGGNDELVFDGQSQMINADGKTLFEAPLFEESLNTVSWKKSVAAPVQDRSVIPRYERIETMRRGLVLGLKDYFRKCHFQKALIGLSGGIDSAVVAAVAVEALGSKNVTGLLMPSPYSSKASVVDAMALAKNLGIAHRLIPIDEIYKSYLATLGINVSKRVPVEAENIQARIRGNILMALSNAEGGLVLSTGNKSELAVGYCTLYGDMAGGLALISDVSKGDVYALARSFNKKKKRIPTRILKKAPSAELRPNQKDSDNLPPYETLDPILKSYVEEHQTVASIVSQGFQKRDVERIFGMVNRNEYKRRQAAPGIKITEKAFGVGRRFPIAWKF